MIDHNMAVTIVRPTWRFSIGVAYYPDHGSEKDMLMKDVEMTMYEAKRRGKDVVYHPDFHRHDLDRRHILAELRRAIGHNDLIVHYQPQFDARSGRIIGVEALVR